MRVAIDDAGRLVIPKRLRDELGVQAAAELDIHAVDGHLELSVPDPQTEVQVRDGFPVFATRDGREEALTGDATRAAIERIRR
ncbi:Antitoxin VapB40 [Paraconexibacter sp. AEG42_29]|uniref:Antitoxin VapB40 n=1 Tax=Paraconexibacter sp. AEG42_29 TaxID=2997339 RepID=A0AAU7B1Z0_9ACTN